MIVLLWIALGVFAIVRQFQARQVNGRALVVLPAVLIGAGWGAVAHLSSVELGFFFGLNLIAAAGLGIWRASTIRIWTDAEQVWQKSTGATAALWLAAVAVRIALTVLGVLGGLSVGQMTAELPVLLGITLGAQNLVLWLRSNPALSFAR
jgi:hypothetical protein